MFFLIHQNTDLCDVSGYGFPTLERARRAAELRIGLPTQAVEARVFAPRNHGFPCWVARPVDGSTGLCREGQMTLIAQQHDVMPIAEGLTRRNGPIYGGLSVQFPAVWPIYPDDASTDAVA